MTPARLRLMLGYLAFLTVIVGLLSLTFHAILLHVPPAHVRTADLGVREVLARLLAADASALTTDIALVDLGVLLLGALGAYVLAGYTLRPVTEARERQRRFAIAASHELRTPLTVLQGTIEAALLRRRTPEQYEAVLRRATTAAEQMGTLLDAILTLAHAESGIETLAVESLDLCVVARAAAEDLRAQAEGKGQTLALALERPLPIRGDPHVLHQAVTNLLDNAISYTPPCGMIRLVGRRTHGHALLAVRDTGPGIALEHLPHLCEPFYRVDPARTGDSGHVGLGLARAAWITLTHGGRLAIESQVGVGSTVTLSLPLDRARGSVVDTRGDGSARVTQAPSR